LTDGIDPMVECKADAQVRQHEAEARERETESNRSQMMGMVVCRQIFATCRLRVTAHENRHFSRARAYLH
jgi:hypothetical protein